MWRAGVGNVWPRAAGYIFSQPSANMTNGGYVNEKDSYRSAMPVWKPPGASWKAHRQGGILQVCPALGIRMHLGVLPYKSPFEAPASAPEH